MWGKAILMKWTIDRLHHSAILTYQLWGHKEGERRGRVCVWGAGGGGGGGSRERQKER